MMSVLQNVFSGPRQERRRPLSEKERAIRASGRRVDLAKLNEISMEYAKLGLLRSAFENACMTASFSEGCGRRLRIVLMFQLVLWGVENLQAASLAQRVERWRIQAFLAAEDHVAAARLLQGMSFQNYGANVKPLAEQIAEKARPHDEQQALRKVIASVKSGDPKSETAPKTRRL